MKTNMQSTIRYNQQLLTITQQGTATHKVSGKINLQHSGAQATSKTIPGLRHVTKPVVAHKIDPCQRLNVNANLL